jgi:hypothetical protein
MAESALAGKQVMLAALFHDLDPMDRLTPWEDHPVASGSHWLEAVGTGE